MYIIQQTFKVIPKSMQITDLLILYFLLNLCSLTMTFFLIESFISICLFIHLFIYFKTAQLIQEKNVTQSHMGHYQSAIALVARGDCSNLSCARYRMSFFTVLHLL